MDYSLKPNLTELASPEMPQTANLASRSGFEVDGSAAAANRIIDEWNKDKNKQDDEEKKGTPITGAGKAVVVDENGNVINDSDVSVGTKVGEDSPPEDPPSFPFDLSTLMSSIEAIQGQLFNPEGMLNTAQDIANFLKTMQEYFTKFPKVTDGDALNLAQSVYNTISTYMANYLNLLYDRQNWVFQQEYNNPLNQIRRFMEAGINPAFYFGSLGNSNAGEIGGSSQTGGQMSAQVQSSNPSLDAVEKGVGVATNLISAGSGVAGTLSTLNYNRAQIDNMKKLQPAQLRNLYSSAFASEAAGEFSRANIGFQKILSDCATEQNQIAWANLGQAWKIAQLASDTSIQSANIGADATVKSAGISASASRYAADTSFAANQQSNQVQGYMKAIDEYYEEVTELGWVENDTGRIFTSESEEWEEINASLHLKAGIDISGGSVEGGGDIGAREGSRIKEGETTTYNKKKYTAKTISYGRIRDYDKFRDAIRAVDGLVKHGSSSPSFNHYMSKGMHVIDQHQRRTLRQVAGDFTKWILSGMTNN